MHKPRLSRLAATFGAILLSAGASAGIGTFEPLTIVTGTGAHTYKVEVMTTPEDRARGLMFRKTMPHDQGMLFDFDRDQPVYFWMKDTLLPLDMIFIDHAGKVVGIKHDAKPMDETVIPSGAPSTGVLELNAGDAAAIGLKVGDTVENGIFGNAK